MNRDVGDVSGDMIAVSNLHHTRVNAEKSNMMAML